MNIYYISIIHIYIWMLGFEERYFTWYFLYQHLLKNISKKPKGGGNVLDGPPLVAYSSFFL